MMWTSLSEEQRKDMKDRMLSALASLAVVPAAARWAYTEPLQHWQLIIESPWCGSHSVSDVNRAREQAVERARLDAPMNGVVLKIPSGSFSCA